MVTMATETATSTQLWLSDRIRPETATTMFPELGYADSRVQLGEWGRRYTDVTPVILDERERALVALRPDDGDPGSLELLRATPLQYIEAGRQCVEPVSHTLARLVCERLGVAQPSNLRLTARRVGAWILADQEYICPGQSTVTICPVVHVDREKRLELEDANPLLQFRSIQDLANGLDESRDMAWVEAVRYSGLLSDVSGLYGTPPPSYRHRVYPEAKIPS